MWKVFWERRKYTKAETYVGTYPAKDKQNKCKLKCHQNDFQSKPSSERPTLSEKLKMTGRRRWTKNNNQAKRERSDLQYQSVNTQMENNKTLRAET